MSKIRTFVFIEPKYIDAENARNIHIFEVEYDTEKKEAYINSSNNESCCGNCIAKIPGKYLVIAAGNSLEERRRDARRLAKEYEDTGKTVCGQCVSTFYSENI